jgi:hypothetical protein
MLLVGAALYVPYSKAVCLNELTNVRFSSINLIIVIALPTVCIRVHQFYERVISKEALHAE